MSIRIESVSRLWRGSVPGAPRYRKADIEAFKRTVRERPGFEASGNPDRDLLEVQAFGSFVEGDRLLGDLEALVQQAVRLGCHVEVARFPLKGPFQVRVHERRSVKLLDVSSDEVRTDHAFIQREMNEAAAALVRAPVALECPCGAAVEPTASRCPGCGRSFKEPVAVAKLPKGQFVRSALKQCAELGVTLPAGGNVRDATLFRPTNARQWLMVTAILRQLRFRLLAPRELERRVAILREIATWPARCPLVARRHGARRQVTTLEEWLTALRDAEVDKAGVLGDLTRLAKPHRAVLGELARDFRIENAGWNAAAQALNLSEGVFLDWRGRDPGESVQRAGFALIASLAGAPVTWAEIGSLETLRWLLSVAPARLPPKLRSTAFRRSSAGVSLLARQRLQGGSLADALRKALGPRRNPKFRSLPAFVAKWTRRRRPLRWSPFALLPIERDALEAALGELQREGWPPSVERLLGHQA